MAEIQVLVTQLESHLNSNELTLLQSLKISPNSTDAHLDDLFLTDTFSKTSLIDHFTLIRSVPNDDLETLETTCLTQANKRLK